MNTLSPDALHAALSFYSPLRKEALAQRELADVASTPEGSFDLVNLASCLTVSLPDGTYHRVFRVSCRRLLFSFIGCSSATTFFSFYTVDPPSLKSLAAFMTYVKVRLPWVAPRENMILTCLACLSRPTSVP